MPACLADPAIVRCPCLLATDLTSPPGTPCALRTLAPCMLQLGAIRWTCQGLSEESDESTPMYYCTYTIKVRAWGPAWDAWLGTLLLAVHNENCVP